MTQATDLEPIQAQPGPQTAFLQSRADIVIYGGAAGGGKSYGLLLEMLRNVEKPGYSGVLFRRTYPELTGAGSIFEVSKEIYPEAHGKYSTSPGIVWRFPRGAIIQMSHMQHDKNAEDHKGREYTTIAYDELTSFSEYQFWYMLSRNRGTIGVRPYIRATTNPDPKSWVRKFISFWLDDEDRFPVPERAGLLRWFDRIDGEVIWSDEPASPFSLSATFIPASLDDNPALTSKDPAYRAKLMAMTKIEREKLLGGDWGAVALAGDYFQRPWFEVVDAPPKRVTMRCRAWDKAATEPSTANPDPDYTAGVKYSRDENGVFYIEDVVTCRERPHGVERRIASCADQDGIGTVVGLWQDPGAAGVNDVANMQRILARYRTHVERASKDKETYAGPVSSQAEAGNMKLVRGPWVDRLMGELEAFPKGNHDDCVDALSLAHIICGDDAGGWLKRINQWR